MSLLKPISFLLLSTCGMLAQQLRLEGYTSYPDLVKAIDHNRKASTNSHVKLVSLRPVQQVLVKSTEYMKLGAECDSIEQKIRETYEVESAYQKLGDMKGRDGQRNRREQLSQDEQAKIKRMRQIEGTSELQVKRENPPRATKPSVEPKNNSENQPSFKQRQAMSLKMLKNAFSKREIGEFKEALSKPGSIGNYF